MRAPAEVRELEKALNEMEAAYAGACESANFHRRASETWHNYATHYKQVALLWRIVALVNTAITIVAIVL